MIEPESNEASDEGSTSETSRAGADRRRRPTPMISRYWLHGRRRGGRRDCERRGIYVDRYTRLESVLVLWIAAAAVADLVLTLLHLAEGGEEANPLMSWFLEVGGVPAFTAAKLTVTAGAALFLLWHIRFRGTHLALWVIAAVYGALMGYHLYAFLDRQAALA